MKQLVEELDDLINNKHDFLAEAATREVVPKRKRKRYQISVS
jgi:hypothetical protein